VFQTLENFAVRKTLSGWIEDDAKATNVEQAAEHQQVWANFVGLFDQMVELLGDETLTAPEFNDVLEAGLESFDLAITPPTVDQVLIGQADRTRTPDLKAVFVLGLNEGEFPRAPRDGSILNERERRDLRKRRIDLDPGLHQRLLDERLLGYVALTRGSQRLFVSRPLADEAGKPTEPSPFWRRIEAMFPGVKRTRVPASYDASPSAIATPRQLVTSLMRWVRRNPDPLASDDGAAWPPLYQWFARSTSVDDSRSPMRSRAWGALRYANSASLAPEVGRAMFASPLSATVSQLETFAACPFRHFLRYGLRLRERDSQQVTAQDLGRLYHELLERGLRDVMRRRAQGESGVRLEQAIEQCVEEIAGRVRDELMLSSARNRYLLDRTRKTLDLAAKAQREIARRGLFRPAHVGVVFGKGAAMPALRIATPAGAEVFLRGTIDRVDRVEGSQDAAVIDYRTGPSRLPIGMVLHGLSLQLLAGLLVLEANGERLSGRNLDPAAAFYVQLVRKIESVSHPDEAPQPADPRWHLKLKPRGLFDRRCLGALDKGLTQGPSEVVSASINKDGSLGRRASSDVADGEEFRAILRSVAQKLAGLGDGILSGTIDIAPYRLNQNSPCPRCEYRSVCRFDPAINKYNHLKNLSRADVLGTGKGEGNGG
jgi:ATP-dependent helicase/nuclease subunit B